MPTLPTVKNATIKGSIEGVKNPLRGIICADEVKDLLLETDIVDPKATDIRCEKIYNKTIM